ncbi:JmjC domain-containing protein [Micromonospora sp. NPDC049102]|uniref:JmjC domain-containing protein n=1 Tax=Micromonospora sp. NPDC049102 TaxID=3364265 RepID=UPI003721D668
MAGFLLSSAPQRPRHLLQGTKTWELFKPKVDAPYRDHSMSTNLWQDGWVKHWQKDGPYQTVELIPGDILVLPRGWVHNPHSRNAVETSVHLTFVLKARVPLWVAERLVGSARSRGTGPSGSRATACSAV